MQLNHSAINLQSKPKKALILLKQASSLNFNLSSWHSTLNHLKKLAVNTLDIVSLTEDNKLFQLFPNEKDTELATANYNYDLFLIIDTEKAKTNIFSQKFFPDEKTFTLKIENFTENQQVLLQLIGCLYVNGINFDWVQLHPDSSGKLISLPVYPFEEKSFWITHLQ